MDRKRIPGGPLAGVMAGLLMCAAPAGASPGAEAPASGTDWARFGQSLADANRRIHNESDASLDPQQRAEIDRTMLWMLAAGIMAIDRLDPAHPDFVPVINSTLLFGAPNPDTVYYITKVDGNGRYLLSGRRGTSKVADIQFMAKMFGFDKTVDRTLANLNLDDLAINRDGTFSVMLSASRPADYKGNWYPLDPRTRYLFVRQIATDWLHERDAEIGIARLDPQASQPRPSPADIASEYDRIASFAEDFMRSMMRQDARHASDPVNDVKLFDVSTSGGNLNQAYYSGRYILKDDEALLMELVPPKDCGYWSVQLEDRLMNSIDYSFHQSSLNNFTAVPDRDGVVRFVLTRNDPGVANWIDTAGYEHGYVLGRYYGCKTTPVPTVKKIQVQSTD